MSNLYWKLFYLFWTPVRWTAGWLWAAERIPGRTLAFKWNAALSSDATNAAHSSSENVMTTEPTEPDACVECGSTKGHKLSCVSGNEQARRHQEALERRYQKNAAAELREIRDCDKCDLCEDHHD